MAEEPERWCIIGGGILGLTLAHRLAAEGRKVTVLEGADRLGGLADAWEIGNVRWDRHYHVTLLSDLHLRSLLEELALGDALRWATTRTNFFKSGRFFALNNMLDYLRFPPLGLIDKARLAGTILYASRIEDGLNLEQIPIETWLVRWSGRRTYEEIWRPLLRAKLGDNYRHASAAFIWAIIRRLYAARRSGLKTEMFGYVEGGYARILESFEALLRRSGVEIKTSSRVRAVRKVGGEVLVTTGTAVAVYDRVVVTTASPVIGKMVHGLSAEERTKHENILYQGIICASLLLKKQLSGCYITYIADESVPYSAVIEMSALVDKANFGGHSLAYLPCYVPSNHELFEVPDDEIEKRFIETLLRMYPHMTRDDILAFRVSRVRNVLAVSTLNYSSHLPHRSTSIPGVYVINSAQIVNGTLNVNETIKLADDAARELLDASKYAGFERPSMLAGAGE